MTKKLTSDMFSPPEISEEDRLPVIVDMAKPATTKVLSDFELARENILDMLRVTKDAIDTTSKLADMSQDSDYYDVLHKLLNTYQKANMELLDLQKKIRNIQAERGPKQVTNQLILTTDQLQKFLNNDRR